MSIKSSRRTTINLAGLVSVLVIAIVLTGSILSTASLAQEVDVSPTEARERDVYFPNSEDLAKNEMRVIACGTGMPTTRAAQAAACFLVELGNGDKFIFDIGSGSAERISSLQIPYDYLDKVFIGHLHADHFGSLGEVFIGGHLWGGRNHSVSGVRAVPPLSSAQRMLFRR